MRTGVLAVVHGRYGRPLVEAAERLVGPLEILVIEVTDDQAKEEVCRLISDGVKERDRGQGVLVIADLGGSTPANACLSSVRGRSGSEVITGLNLPMLIKLSTCDREQTAPELARLICQTAQRSIQIGVDLQHLGRERGD